MVFMKHVVMAILFVAVLIAGCTGVNIQSPPAAPNLSMPKTTEMPGAPNTTDIIDGSKVLTDPNQTQWLPPEGSPVLVIVSPEQDEVLKTTIIGVKVDITSFRLAGIDGRENKDNEGHILATLDDAAKTSSVNTFAFSNVAEGIHTLTVELVNNDGTSLDPPVKETVSFTTE